MAERKRRTAIKFAIQRTTYTAGAGSATNWEKIVVPIGTDADGNTITTDTFYCEWLGSYGAAAIQQQADGVNRVARVRMTFVLPVYNALLSEPVRIFKDGIEDALHTFTLASSADDLLGENQTIEFQVQHYAGK
jgi:hypothetical protein